MRSSSVVLCALLLVFLASFHVSAQVNQMGVMTIPESPIPKGEYFTVIVPVRGCYVFSDGITQKPNSPAMNGVPTVTVTAATLSSSGTIEITVSELGTICPNGISEPIWYAVPVILGSNLHSGIYRINYPTHQMSLDIVVNDTMGSSVIVPRPGLWAITSEVNGLPGRGFQVELSGNTLVLTFYGYDAQGKGNFWLASGTYAYNQFSGDLVAYQGGTTFGGPHSSANLAGSPGRVTLFFTSPTTGTITLPNEPAKEISYFAF